jgi:hypothetical protein
MGLAGLLHLDVLQSVKKMQSIYTNSSTGDHTADTLKLVINSERALVGMYAERLKVLSNESLAQALAASLHCHQRRADLLAGEVRRMGAKPDQTSTSWRASAFTMEGGSAEAQDQTSLKALLNAETKLSAQYDKWACSIDFGVQHLLRQLQPLQGKTLSTVNNLLVETNEISLAA